MLGPHLKSVFPKGWNKFCDSILMAKKEILIIEDDSDVGILIGFVLSKFYDFRICATITEAEREIDKRIPDLFLIDIMLPDGNGADLCNRLKSSAKTNKIPVILMSAMENPSYSLADNFIRKPFNIHAFKSTIEIYLLEKDIH